MSSSKFIEHLDTEDTPYSHANVSLHDVLDETSHRGLKSASSSRSSSASSGADNNNAESSPTREHSMPVKTLLRGLTVKRSKT